MNTALTAKLLGLKAVHSEFDLIEQLEQGLTIATVHSLRVRANLTDAETYQLIPPRRTLNRREASGQLLSSEEADKAVRIARVTARAQKSSLDNPRMPRRGCASPNPRWAIARRCNCLPPSPAYSLSRSS